MMSRVGGPIVCTLHILHRHRYRYRYRYCNSQYYVVHHTIVRGTGTGIVMHAHTARPLLDESSLLLLVSLFFRIPTCLCKQQTRIAPLPVGSTIPVTKWGAARRMSSCPGVAAQIAPSSARPSWGLTWRAKFAASASSAVWRSVMHHCRVAAAAQRA